MQEVSSMMTVHHSWKFVCRVTSFWASALSCIVGRTTNGATVYCCASRNVILHHHRYHHHHHLISKAHANKLYISMAEIAGLWEQPCRRLQCKSLRWGGKKWSTKAAISLKRVKIEEKLLWRVHRNSPTIFRTVPSPPSYGLLFPKIGGSHTTQNFNRSQKRVKIRTSNLAGTFTVSMGVSRDCTKFLSTPYYPRNG